jgi:N-acetylglutamate synthase-like GNAT family acetyltransferase
MIRKATEKDIASIVDQIKEYSEDLNMKGAKQRLSLGKTANLVAGSISQGLSWVYEKDGKIVGITLAEERFNLFSRTAKEIYLLAFWVSKQYRNGTIGGRLLIKFNEECDKRDIAYSWIGIQEDTGITERSLSKLGYRPQERFFLKER